MFKMQGKYTYANVMIDDVESECIKQITQFLNHEAFTNPVAIMADTHAGKGSVIGFTMKLTEKVIPNVISVDIGCGVLAGIYNQNIFKSKSMEIVESQIRERIPFGFATHKRPKFNLEREFDWNKVKESAQYFADAYNKEFGVNIRGYIPDYSYDWFKDKCNEIGMSLSRACDSIGTLGGGNHYLEFGKMPNGYILTIHTGSRNFGKMICEYWQKGQMIEKRKSIKNKFRRRMNEIKEQAITPELRQQIPEQKKKLEEELGLRKLNSSDLDWLSGEQGYGYLFDMIFTQAYAEANRHTILRIINDILGLQPDEIIESVHNYIDFNDLIIRKGAIKSYADEKMVIPLNMRDGILICEGRSNSEWNYSAPHGAGRIMSRSKAKEQLSLNEFQSQMDGIYSTSVCQSTLDEAPNAYKDSRMIEEAIEPTARIISKVKPVMNLKAR